MEIAYCIRGGATLEIELDVMMLFEHFNSISMSKIGRGKSTTLLAAVYTFHVAEA